MRTLTRPMFNMGGPIKQGVMHGIREPKKHGGKMLLVGQHPKEFQDKSGREKHVWPLLAWGATALRAAPVAYRGAKAARMFTPWKQNLGKWGRFKDIFLPSGRFRSTTKLKGGDPAADFIKGDFTAGAGTRSVPGSPLGFWKSMGDPKRFGAAIGENPVTAFGVASLAPQAGYGAYKLAKAAPGTIWEGTKRYADLVIPGDQSRWWKDKEPPTGVPLNPNLQMNIQTKKQGKGKELTDQQRKDFANTQRNQRVQKYLDMMGYDRSKKTAIADALIDASKIVSDRGTLDRKNITAELINPAIQALSKRLDKPEQIREAVGLMATKAEIEKDLNKETKDLDRRYKKAQIAVAEKGLEATESFEGGLRAFLSDRKGTVDKTTLERIARLLANEHKETFTKVTDETDVTTLDDGIYMSEGKIIRMTDGVPTQIV